MLRSSRWQPFSLCRYFCARVQRGDLMRQRTFTLGVVTAAIAATCAFGMPAASAAPTHHFWFGYAGSSAVADTVAEDLLQGNSVGQAQALASELASLTTPTTAAVINRALDQDATGHD